jgi:hypothetical protein
MDVRPGMVFYLPFCSLYGQAGTKYNKFAIVGRTDPDVLMLMVCTEIPAFAKKNARLLRAHVAIDKATHPFLEYDSWVDCNDAKDEYSLMALAEAYVSDASCLVGEVSRDVLKKVVGGVDTSIKLERRKQRSISAALNQAINS